MDGVTLAGPHIIISDARTGDLINPFDEDASHILLDNYRPIRQSQLREEIEALVGHAVRIVVQDRLDGPDVLFVAPPVPDEIVCAAYLAHEVDQNFGESEVMKAGRAALLKARDGKTLTTKEISAYIGAFG